MDPIKAKAAALSFLKHNVIGTFATVSPSGQPHASLVYYASNDRFIIYFSTLVSTRKYADIMAHPFAAFTVSTADMPQTLQLEGAVSVVAAEERMEKDLALLIQPLTSNKIYQWPIAKFTPAEVVVMRLEPTWVRWGDFANFEQGTEKLFCEIPLV